MAGSRSSLSAVFEQTYPQDIGVGWRLGWWMAKLHPGKAVLDGVVAPFDLMEYAGAGHCTATLAPGVHAQFQNKWSRAHGLQTSTVNAIYDVTWQKHRLRVLVAEWRDGFHCAKKSVVVADTMEVARAFATAGSAFCNAPGNAVMRFADGAWERSHDLWLQVQNASFEDLILAGDLKKLIQEDFTYFLAAKAEYERYGIPHKRGVLFTGPPGNGKTHCLRAVMRFVNVPCLYVMSLRDKYTSDYRLIELVFDRAREVSPCCLVLEDIDAMIDDKNRSYFLNQLDGLAGLPGVLTIATTNHPDRLDPAIVERPSRFDRKYHFDLPQEPERRAYLQLWNNRAEPALRVKPEQLEQLVTATHGFSFAYLKELYVSSLMRWVTTRKAGHMGAEMLSQVHILRTQMHTELAAAAKPPAPRKDDDDEDD